MLTYRSLRTIWIVLTPLAAVGLCCVLLARKYTLKRNVVKAGDRPASAGNTEGGQTVEKANTDQKLENGMPDASSASNDSTAKSEEAN
jgi:hypothetical protein